MLLYGIRLRKISIEDIKEVYKNLILTLIYGKVRVIAILIWGQ